MRLLFLGSGSAHTVDGDNFQSNMLLVTPSGRRLLIDCGTDIRWSLARLQLSYRDITDIYISHLHADHIGGLEGIGFQTKFDPRCERPRLYIERILSQQLWAHSLQGGMYITAAGENTLDTFFDVRPLDTEQPFEWGDAHLTPVPVVHVVAPRHTVHSYGLLIRTGARVTFLTADTQFHPDRLQPYYASADVIFHDCETAKFRTGVHAHYEELLQLPAAVRAKTWLYDYQPGPLPNAVADGFRGFVLPGQSFDLLDPG